MWDVSIVLVGVKNQQTQLGGDHLVLSVKEKQEVALVNYHSCLPSGW